MFVVGGGDVVKGQRVYATQSTQSATGIITGLSNVRGANTTTPPAGSIPANITVTGTTGALGGSPVSAFINLQFASNVPLNTVVFIKVSAITLPSIASSISAAAYNNSTIAAGSAFYELVAGDGTLYIGVYATGTFNTARLIVTAGGGGLLGAPAETASSNVFYAYYNTSNIADCGLSLGTSWSGNGTVSNSLNAIDGNMSTFSNITPSVLLSTVEQSFHFSGPSVTNDEVKATLSIPPTVLSLGLLSNIAVNAYNGSSTTPVWSSNLGAILSLDLLGLFNTGAPITVSVKPTLPFDRLSINYAAVLGLLVTLRVHEVQRTTASPVFTVQNLTICANNTATLIATAPAGNVTKWYDAAGTLLFTGNSFTTPVLSTTTTYYAATAKNSCSGESLRLPAVVTVNPLPAVTDITGTTTLCAGSNTTLGNATAGGSWDTSDPLKATVSTGGVVTGIAPGTATITYTITGANGCTNTASALITINALPVVPPITGTTTLCMGGTATLSNATPGGTWTTSDPLKATVSAGGVVTGIAIGTATITYTVTGANGCVNSASTPVTINLQPSLPAISPRSICLGQTVDLSSLNPADANGSTTGSYIWSATAGGAALSSTTVTPPLGNTTYYVRYTINGCFSDSNVLIVVHPKPPTPHVILNLN